ncbi:MAG: glycosyltransferase family 4 protein [Candidatus Andersenbacteria bacterium]|nr:glycosyltransferase family 4 protein [Candidatus Andersenbacteria bacterium]MBI3250268.1 glycosyltransferase family 4 protein [Candidatus Andersenbacteria bacterium]
MRIVHTCLRYPPSTGGVETYVQELVERTRNINEGRDVRVLTSKMRMHSPIEELNPELLLNDPPYVQRLHHLKTPLLSYPRLQALRYYLTHHKPDILHGYSFWYQPADVTARYAREHAVPFIFHPMYYENKTRQKKTWQLYKKYIGRKTFEAADVVVVISPFEQKLIEAACFPVKRFEVIPPGVDVDEFERPRINPFLKRKIRGTILLTVSRLSPGKGLEDLIQVLPTVRRQIPDIQLVVVGEDFGLLEQLRVLARRIGVDSSIHFLGKLSREELIGAYQQATIFIHPSYYEAFGIVIAEAQAAGTPIIARDTAAIPFVTAPMYQEMLFSSSEQLVRNIMDTLAKDTMGRELDARKAKDFVAINFSWDTSVNKIISLYDDLRKSH